MAFIKKFSAMGAVGALAAGTLIAGAGAASAANDPGFTKVKAPKTVTAGKTFLIKCQLATASGQSWAGSDAQLQEKGAPINATRSIASNGDCSMHVVLDATGNKKIRVWVKQSGGAIKSRWLKINVQPAS